MNQQINLDNIMALIHSDHTASEIAKISGVPQPNISSLRNGKRSIENMTIKSGLQLQRAWEIMLRDNV